MSKDCIVIGAPIDSGQKRPGCLMGPSACRVAGIAASIRALGHRVADWGDLALPAINAAATCPNPAVHSLAETVGWTAVVAERVGTALSAGGFPIVIGGDHSLSLGSVSAAAAWAMREGRPLFVLWLDAHSDIHTPMTTQSGNLHGTPVAYLAGMPGFEAFPPFPCPVAESRICLFGIRSIDPAEHAALSTTHMTVCDMRVIDERGIVAPLREFLDRVQTARGMLHVSLDVDVLDPLIAPAIGTTVPGGLTVREAHLVMELLHDSDLVTSLDLAELNPFLDERGKTATLLVELVGSLLGRKVFDRRTRSG